MFIYTKCNLILYMNGYDLVNVIMVVFIDCLTMIGQPPYICMSIYEYLFASYIYYYLENMFFSELSNVELNILHYVFTV